MKRRSLVRFITVPAAAIAMAACGGSQRMPAAQAPAPSAAMGRPSSVTPQMIAAGDSLFNAPHSCNGCHGKGGLDGRNGPNLTTGKYEHVDGSYASIVKIVTDGIPKAEIKHPEHRFPMRPRGGHHYTDEQIRNLAAYVWTLGHK